MKQIAITRSLLQFLDELEYTEAALAADPDTVELAEPFREAIGDWEGVARKERQARRDVTRAEAAVEVRNEQIDRLTIRFGGVVLLEAGQDRKSALFRRFFPVAPSEFVRQSLRKQCELTQHVLVPEIGKLDKVSPLRPFAPLLQKASQAALEALDARSKAKATRAMASGEVDEWKEGVNRLRLGTYAGLLKIAAERGYGKAWAETFFRKDSAAGTAEEGDAAHAAPDGESAAQRG